MPDRDKVIKCLEACTGEQNDCAGHTCPYWDFDGEVGCRTQMEMDALALLKEQDAVKPIPFFTETGTEAKNYVVCGHCRSINAIMPIATKQKYCHECGHPVNWEGR